MQNRLAFLLIMGAFWIWSTSPTTFAQTEAPSPALGIDRWGSVPVVDEEPYYLLPPGYSKASFERNRPGVYVIGFYRDNKSASDWKEVISVSALYVVNRNN